MVYHRDRETTSQRENYRHMFVKEVVTENYRHMFVREVVKDHDETLSEPQPGQSITEINTEVTHCSGNIVVNLRNVDHSNHRRWTITGLYRVIHLY